MSETSKEKRGTRMLIAAGLVVLAVPSITLLMMADDAFRERCRTMCVERSYRVTTSSGGPTMADCHCIDKADRTVWEKVRDFAL